MATQAGNIPHTDTVNFPVLMATQTRILFWPERVYGFAMTVLAGKFFHENMSGMTCGFIDGKRTLGSLVPMTFRARFPWCLVAMRFGRLAIRREDEFYQ